MTIQPDVRVWFKADAEEDYYGLIVKGKLIADGAPGADSLFRPWTVDVGRWTVESPGIQFAPVRLAAHQDFELREELGSWKGVWFEASADSSSIVRVVRIAYAQVGIKADHYALRVEEAEVVHSADVGILFNGGDGGVVLGCTVRGNATGIRFELVKGGEIRGCVVEDNRDNGIECKTSSPDIEDNLIQANGWGIYCWSGASPAIRWNTLVDQVNGGIGQFEESFSEITANLVVQDIGDGIVIGSGHSAPRIRGNNLLSWSDGYAVRVELMGNGIPDVDATENYWGSEDPLEIEVNIYDGRDTRFTLDPSSCHPWVVFEPFAVYSISAAGMRMAEFRVQELRSSN